MDEAVAGKAGSESGSVETPEERASDLKDVGETVCGDKIEETSDRRV